jgi:predicted metalloprotease
MMTSGNGGLISRIIRGAAVLAGAIAIAGAVPTRVEPSMYVSRQATVTAALGVTNRDVAASNEKIRMAAASLAHMWQGYFAQVGERFDVPALARYRGDAPSACGIMKQNNAGYCPSDNTIYFDEVFVAAQAKAAGRQLGTDGDMAAVGIIAHEMGHAVSIQLGYRSRSTYAMEATADCLAGAFAEQADRDGELEPGDIDEAFFGMAAAGDPTPELTGDSRIDRRILRAASVMGHGTREQRTANFRRGLEGGPGACLDEFRS